MNETVVGIVGLGYVGLPLALSMGRKYSRTIGFDVNEEKIAQLCSGEDPTEEGLEKDIAESSVEFVADEHALKQCDFLIVAVPTPIDENRQPDLRILVSAVRL